MYTVAHARDFRQEGTRTARFEGEPYGAGVSFYLVDSDPGEGPALHRHPYTETWVVISGRAAITLGEERAEAGPGDIVTVLPPTPHKFRVVGQEALRMVCIHASARMVEETLEDDGAA